MKQVISVAPDGVISGLQVKPGAGLDLRKLGGLAMIERATEILWDDDYQAWTIELRPGKATEALTGVSTMSILVRERDYQMSTRRFGMPEKATGKRTDGVLLFEEYQDAVDVEIAVLDGLRLAGKLS